ncbi:unnamed protein product [Phytophthora lilii]|uniref:Unnamed protein product n=1 Tax=Phytophthora lilii TaxID=2077276 RepID=A0A9W6TBB9_9STRA|nr:unnamed protein product [Phytophthora lilii]
MARIRQATLTTTFNTGRLRTISILTNTTTGANYYFISCAENPSSYALQITLLPVKNITGYTAASGFPTMPVSAYTPQLQVVDSAFGSIIGFSPATYPAAQTTRVYAVNSNLVP